MADPNSVPTMGHYFRAAGYETFWKGEWHASDEDIFIPVTYNAYASYSAKTGSPTTDGVALYENANRLNAYGFSVWIGP